jgi:glycosyltransferase involved in cell wall biosynthesis
VSSDITVVIPSFNPGKYLIDALESVYNQTYSDWKVILVDDCSEDNSLALAQHLLKDPRILVIKNKENLGQSKAQNIALASVDTPYMVQLDSDDWLLPHALETLLSEFKKQEEDVAVVSANIEVSNEMTEHLGNKKDNRQKFILKGRLFKDKYDFLCSNLSLWPRCYRTSALRRVGGWPVNGPYEGRHLEDKRVLYRLIEYYRFHWIDEVLYVHRRHDHNNTLNVDAYNIIIEFSIKEILKRWGNKYKPVFRTNSQGWRMLDRLVPKLKRN